VADVNQDEGGAEYGENDDKEIKEFGHYLFCLGDVKVTPEGWQCLNTSHIL
jgi:hypothetical protein